MSPAPLFGKGTSLGWIGKQVSFGVSFLVVIPE
jgi:hypothetical protein